MVNCSTDVLVANPGGSGHVLWQSAADAMACPINAPLVLKTT
jgi:hypothetical protein